MNRRLAALVMLGAAMMADYPTPRKIHKTEGGNIQQRKIIPKGAKLYTFEDGFECFARTQEKADKKHEAWLNKA